MLNDGLQLFPLVARVYLLLSDRGNRPAPLPTLDSDDLTPLGSRTGHFAIGPCGIRISG